MNFGPHEASLYVHKLNEKVKPSKGVEVVLCPPFISLFSMARDLDKSKFKLGAQNMHALDHGPYTGEVSGAMLRGLVDYVIIGHSERRQHFHERDKEIAAKVAAAVRNHLTPILCVGDSLLDREHGHARKVVVDQLSVDLANLTAEEVAKVVIAYEPLWAIGTGDFAKPGEVEPIVGIIQTTIADLYGPDVAKKVPILYGGSVVADNAKGYLELNGIDGLLVGTASLHAHSFADIVAAAQK